MRRLLVLSPLCVLVACSPSPQRGSPAAGAAPVVTKAPLPAPGQSAWQVPVTPSARAAVVWSGNLQGRIEPASLGEQAGGGVARRAAYLAWVRQSNPGLPVLHLEVGNSLSPEPRRAAALLSALKASGLHAYNIGAYELASGLGALLEITRHAGLAFVSTNLLREDGSPVFPQYLMLRVRDPKGRPLRVLVLGVGGRSATDGVPAFADFAPPREALEGVLGPLRGTADLTLLLASGFEPRTLACALEEVAGIDLILSGSGPIDPQRSLMDTCRQRVALGGLAGLWLSDLRFEEQDFPSRVRHSSPLLLDKFPESPEIAARLAEVPELVSNEATPGP